MPGHCVPGIFHSAFTAPPGFTVRLPHHCQSAVRSLCKYPSRVLAPSDNKLPRLHMMKTINYLSIVLVLAELSGCATYTEPAKDEPQATLHIITHLPRGVTASWMSYDDAQCESQATMLGAFSALYDGEKKIQLRANETRYLRVNATSHLAGDGSVCTAKGMGPNCHDNLTCTVQFEITPVAGKIYRTELLGTGKECAIKIADERTGHPDPSFKQIPTQKSCMPRNSVPR